MIKPYDDDFLKFNIKIPNAYLFKINPIFVPLQKRKKNWKKQE